MSQGLKEEWALLGWFRGWHKIHTGASQEAPITYYSTRTSTAPTSTSTSECSGSDDGENKDNFGRV